MTSYGKTSEDVFAILTKNAALSANVYQPMLEDFSYDPMKPGYSYNPNLYDP